MPYCGPVGGTGAPEKVRGPERIGAVLPGWSLDALRDLQPLDDVSLPVVLADGGQEATYHGLGHPVRDHALGGRNVNVKVLEDRNRDRALQYGFRHIGPVPPLDLSRCELVAYQGQVSLKLADSEVHAFRFFMVRRTVAAFISRLSRP
jgi:hypothetical protein